MKCVNCLKPVKQQDGKRHKLYCNEACRKQYARKCLKQVNTMKSEAAACSVVDEQQSIGTKPYPDGITGQTNNGQPLPDAIVAIPGQCWCCGDDLDTGLVCCGPCAWSGKAKEKRAGRYPPLLTDRTPEQMEADLHAPVLTGPGLVIGKPGDDDYNGICR